MTDPELYRTHYLLLPLFDGEEFVVEVWRLTLAGAGDSIPGVDVGQDTAGDW